MFAMAKGLRRMIAMSEFTQGKWVYDEQFGVVYSDKTNMVIANVRGAGHITVLSGKHPVVITNLCGADTGSCVCLTPEGQANARLIAAAPELYKLLKEELIPISDYGGILSFERERKVTKLLDRIDGKEDSHDRKTDERHGGA